ncbi:hypothetical protein Tco_0523291 [Tanacetum coccineum]
MASSCTNQSFHKCHAEWISLLTSTSQSSTFLPLLTEGQMNELILGRDVGSITEELTLLLFDELEQEHIGFCFTFLFVSETMFIEDSDHFLSLMCHLPLRRGLEVVSDTGSLIVTPPTGARPCGRKAGSKLSLIAPSSSSSTSWKVGFPLSNLSVEATLEGFFVGEEPGWIVDWCSGCGLLHGV